MDRLLVCFLALVILAGGEVLMVGATAQPLGPPDGAKRDEDKEFIEKFRKTHYGLLRIRESKPVTVKDAQFVIVAQTEWIPPKPNHMFPVVAPLDIQLRITNLSKSAVLFSTVDTFGVRLYSAGGKEIKPRVGRKGTAVTKPVLIPEGASYSLWRRAELRWDERAKASELAYYDGTGSQAIIGPLAPGRYKLAFWYAVSPDKGGKRKGGEAKTWVGEVVTNEVRIEVIKGETRGIPTDVAEKRFPQEVARPLKGLKEVLRIRESRPVTVKDAQFVVIAESDWKAGEGTTAIDIQLRIKNLSKQDMLFHTFDTFYLVIKGADGKPIMATGGRNLTILTRPVLIPGGASYSICRKAELRWKADTKTNELFHWDGTGSEYVFGPLRPGRYQVSFWYGVSPNPPLKALLRPERKAADPLTWLGATVTGEVPIQLRKR
jgi:hypothetical protein